MNAQRTLGWLSFKWSELSYVSIVWCDARKITQLYRNKLLNAGISFLKIYFFFQNFYKCLFTKINDFHTKQTKLCNKFAKKKTLKILLLKNLQKFWSISCKCHLNYIACTVSEKYFCVFYFKLVYNNVRKLIYIINCNCNYYNY